MRAFFLALCFLATPAVAADQFDLNCKAEFKTSVDGRWKPTTFHYRIDLKALRWCEGTCNGTEQIAEVKDTQLTLLNRERKLSEYPSELLWVDRQTGALSYIRAGGIGDYEQRRGTCEAADFSGFPEVQRKF